MEKSIFTKPLFINPQAYFVIPELSTISKCIPFEFNNGSYTFKINTNGIIDTKVINTNKETILRLDLILNTGNIVLGEWIIGQQLSDIKINQYNNIIQISLSEQPSKECIFLMEDSSIFLMEDDNIFVMENQ